MAQAVNENWPFVVNLGNSIIGVAVLAMPFCFKQCGILLGMLVLLFCTWLTLTSCQLLVKAGIVSHRRSYEFLAYHTYGAPGKFMVEIGMIGMQLGTLVAQIVVIGDLGPPIVSLVLGVENNARTRIYLMVFLCLMVGLPLGLMKDLRNVSRASTICIAFYSVFTVYMLWYSSSNLWSAEWFSHVEFWRPQGLFQCLPIMSFSFGCQTQLFILYDALPNPSLHTIKGIIHSAVSLCTVAYMLVGFFGYVAFYEADIPGDIITVFPPSLASHLIKLGFVMSIAITFPVIIYPCRASIYTLLFQKKSKLSDDVTSTYIPEFLFKGITVAIVIGSMITGILIPNVEFILGMNGAITGTLICYIFPALFFLRVMSSKAEGKTIAQIVLVLGVSIMLVSTFTTLYAQDKGHVHGDVQKTVQEAANKLDLQVDKNHLADADNKQQNIVQPPVQKDADSNEREERRIEPPNPDAPAPDEKVVGSPLKRDKEKSAKKEGDIDKEIGKGGDAAANKGKEKEGEGQEKRQEQLLDALEIQRREQEKLLNEQKALLKELKDHKEQQHQPEEAQQQAAGQQGQGLQQGQGQAQGQRESGQVQQQGEAQNVQPNAGLQQAQLPQGVVQQAAVGQQQQVNQQGGQVQGLAANNPALNNPIQGHNPALNNEPQQVIPQNAAVNNQAPQVNPQNAAGQQQVIPNAAAVNQVKGPAVPQLMPRQNNPVQQQAGQNPPLNNPAQQAAQNLPMENAAQQPVQDAFANQARQFAPNPAANNQATIPQGNKQQALGGVGARQGLAPLGAQAAVIQDAAAAGQQGKVDQGVAAAGLKQGGEGHGAGDDQLGDKELLRKRREAGQAPGHSVVEHPDMVKAVLRYMQEEKGKDAANSLANTQDTASDSKVTPEENKAKENVKTDSKPDVKMDGKSETETGSKPDVVKMDSKTEAETGSKADVVKIDGKSETETGSKPDVVKMDGKSETETGSKPDVVKMDGKSETETGSKADVVKMDGKSETETGSKPDVVKMDGKTEAETGSKADVVKMEGKTEAETGSKPDVKMDGKTEAETGSKADGKKGPPVEEKAREGEPIAGSAHKQEMRKLKGVSEGQDGHLGAGFDGAEDLGVEGFLHAPRQGALIRSLKSKDR
ncbi:putative sodium-coupled neutral amino acid transporter 10 isoform X2 [Littorina saxatilis]|uniref:Amino acid transporter transmembrane domain-containing protein n=1 Tax=Littorina saxatilis TaxID=31220 RepID=A0AAN9GLF5_9CAEN